MLLPEANPTVAQSYILSELDNVHKDARRRVLVLFEFSQVGRVGRNVLILPHNYFLVARWGYGSGGRGPLRRKKSKSRQLKSRILRVAPRLRPSTLRPLRTKKSKSRQSKSRTVAVLWTLRPSTLQMKKSNSRPRIHSRKPPMMSARPVRPTSQNGKVPPVHGGVNRKARGYQALEKAGRAILNPARREAQHVMRLLIRAAQHSATATRDEILTS